MISLSKLVAEEGARSDKFGDRFPPPMKVSIPAIDPNFSELDRLFAALRSSCRPLVLWGLATFPRVCEHEKHAFKLVPSITILFTNPYRPIEFAAITCVIKLLKIHARPLSASLLPRVLDRLDQCPAQEYVFALSQILPYCTDATFESCISPLILRFLTRDESYQCAVAELLLAIRFAQIPPSPDLFARLLNSPVIVNGYLATLVQYAAETGAIVEDWCCRLYPARLMRAGIDSAAIRPGVVRVILLLLDLMHPSIANNYLATAVGWGETSPDVALLLLSEADVIINPSNLELVPRLHALLGRLAMLGTVAVLEKLPRILGSNPAVLLNAAPDLEQIINALAVGEASVRLAFLEDYLLLFARMPGRASQEALLSAFIQLFENPSKEVAAKLAVADTYAFFGSGKLLQIVPVFARFTVGLTAWRDIEHCAETFLSFPSDVVRATWESVARSLLPLFARHCHPLMRACPTFCNRLYASLDMAGREVFVGVIAQTFADNRQWGVRKLMLSVLTRLAGQGAQVVRVFLPSFVPTLADPIPAVVIAALRAWQMIRTVVPNDEEIRARIAALANSPNEEILAVLQDVGLESARGDPIQARSVGEGRLPRLAASKSASIHIIGDGQRWNSAGGLTQAPPKVAGRPPPGILVKPKKRTYATPVLQIRDSGKS